MPKKKGKGSPVVMSLNLVEAIVYLPSQLTLKMIEQKTPQELNKEYKVTIENKGKPITNAVNPLIMAIIINDVPIVLELLKSGANVNLPDKISKATPLNAAIVGNKLYFVGALLAYEADIEIKDSLGKKAYEYSPEAAVGTIINLFLKMKSYVDTFVNKGGNISISSEDVAYFNILSKAVPIFLKARLDYLKLKGKHQLPGATIEKLVEEFQKNIQTVEEGKEVVLELGAYFKNQNVKKCEIEISNNSLENSKEEADSVTVGESWTDSKSFFWQTD